MVRKKIDRIPKVRPPGGTTRSFAQERSAFDPESHLDDSGEELVDVDEVEPGFERILVVPLLAGESFSGESSC